LGGVAEDGREGGVFDAQIQELPPARRVEVLEPRLGGQRQTRWRQAQVLRCAGPRMMLGALRQARPDGVELHVRQRVPDVGAGQNAGKIARLPEMAASAVAGVDVAGVGRVSPFEGAMERFRRLRDGDQMDVIGHQAESGELHAVAFRGFADEAQVDETVPIFKEDRLLICAPLGDVVGVAAGDNARNPGHTMT